MAKPVEVRKKYDMPVVCAWCQAFMYMSESIKPDTTSHGICPDCIEDQLSKLKKQYPTKVVCDFCGTFQYMSTSDHPDRHFGVICDKCRKKMRKEGAWDPVYPPPTQ